VLRGTLFIVLFVMNTALWAAAYFGLNVALPASLRGSIAPADHVLYVALVGAFFSTLPVIRWLCDEEHPNWWLRAGIWGAMVFPIAGAIIEVATGHSGVQANAYADTFYPLFVFADLVAQGVTKLTPLAPVGFVVGLAAASLTVWISRELRGITTRQF
jgi:hypothetical protein